MPPRSTTAFDFTTAMRRLCTDVCRRMAEFAHIDMEQVAVAFAQARRRTPYGLQAKLTPMRFEHGSLTTKRHGKTWTVQRLFQHDREMLYVLTFYLPRFLNQTFREKMITVFHELQHIGPQFDGDIRRHAGRYHVHTASQTEFDRQMGVLVDRYLADRPPKELYAFLRMNFATLGRKHGGVEGTTVPIPKLIPVEGSGLELEQPPPQPSLDAIANEMAATLLRDGSAASPQAREAALVLVRAAWNLSLGDGAAAVGCQAELARYSARFPNLWLEFIDPDPLTMVARLVELKRRRHPSDRRSFEVD